MVRYEVCCFQETSFFLLVWHVSQWPAVVSIIEVTTHARRCWWWCRACSHAHDHNWGSHSSRRFGTVMRFRFGERKKRTNPRRPFVRSWTFRFQRERSRAGIFSGATFVVHYWTVSTSVEDRDGCLNSPRPSTKARVFSARYRRRALSGRNNCIWWDVSPGPCV